MTNSEPLPVDLLIEIKNLLCFAQLHADAARQMARAGFKDNARDWFRYLLNSRICEIGQLAGQDCKGLRETLTALEHECHPHEPLKLSGELRSTERILKLMQDQDERLARLENKAKP